MTQKVDLISGADGAAILILPTLKEGLTYHLAPRFLSALEDIQESLRSYHKYHNDPERLAADITEALLDSGMEMIE